MEQKMVMVDLVGQYRKIKNEIDTAIEEVISSATFIKGPAVAEFEENLCNYMYSGSGNIGHVVTCGNGTDALQIALMALGLKPGDEVIVPAFTYIASAEVIALLGLKPVMVDVDYNTFCVTIENIKRAYTPKTKAIIPVHLFGQCCDMEPILEFAKERNIFVIEDAAQAIGSTYRFSDGRRLRGGTMGDIGCTSFFPSKNLGCFGDGGALFVKDETLAQKVRMIANHGQKVKYRHDVVGCNSRLDSIQAAILNVKLRHLDEYCQSRADAANYYTNKLKELDPCERVIVTPSERENTTHTYHQYTLKVKGNYRDELKSHLAGCGVPSMIYYPLALQEQEAFKDIAISGEDLTVSKELAGCVLSLPIHTELDHATQNIVVDAVAGFLRSI